MANVFGIVSGAVGIATAFSACIEVFDYVQLGRRFGKDYQTAQLRLTLLKLRLSRWGTAVNIYDDPLLGNHSATEEDIEFTKSILLHILLLFEDSQKISDRYKTRNENAQAMGSQDLSVTLAAEMVTRSINNRMKALADQRRTGVSVLKLVSWAITDNKVLSRLLEDISGLIDSLEQLFPPSPALQAELAAREISEVQGEQELGVLASTAESIDPVLQTAAQHATGHQYKNILIDAGEDAGILNGDTTSSDYRGPTNSGQSHTYDGITIKSTKGLLVQNGDQRGGPAFFSRS